MDLHDAYGALGHTATFLTGKKTTTREDVAEIRRPFWRKALSYAMANDFDFFDGDQILKSKAFRQADIVHCHNLLGWYFGLPVLPKLAKIKPVVWTLHDMWALTPRSAYTASTSLRDGMFELSHPDYYPTMPWNNDAHLRTRKKKILGAADIHIVTPCKWLAEKVAQTYLSPKPLSVIYNGIDLTAFKPSEAVSNGATRTILFAGTTDNPFKGYRDFLWMAEQCRDDNVRFLVVGAAADRSAGNVTEIAKTSDKSAMAALLSAADVLVMPTQFEVFPLLAIEALACGTPVIAYDAGGVGELLELHPRCATVPFGDKDAMLKLALEVARPGKTPDMVRSLRCTAETGFSIQTAAEHYLALFSQLLRGRTHAL